MRMSTTSVAPPKYPDRIPNSAPITIAITAAVNPTIIETRPPKSTRLSTSIPPSSQPSQCSGDGGAKTAQLGSVVLYGASTSAATERTTKNAMITMPTIAGAVVRERAISAQTPPRECERVLAFGAVVPVGVPIVVSLVIGTPGGRGGSTRGRRGSSAAPPRP